MLPYGVGEEGTLLEWWNRAECLWGVTLEWLGKSGWLLRNRLSLAVVICVTAFSRYN